MKVSEFIERLKELQAAHGGDPYVAIQNTTDSRFLEDLEPAGAELCFVSQVGVIPEAPRWQVKGDLSSQVVRIY